MGHQETFQQFREFKEKVFGKNRNIDFLDYVPSHDNCTKSISNILNDMNLKSGGKQSDFELFSELKEVYNFFSEIGQLLVRKEGIPPSPLSIQFKQLFDSFYTIY